MIIKFRKVCKKNTKALTMFKTGKLFTKALKMIHEWLKIVGNKQCCGSVTISFESGSGSRSADPDPGGNGSGSRRKTNCESGSGSNLNIFVEKKNMLSKR
jgi:hypothetical protein